MTEKIGFITETFGYYIMIYCKFYAAHLVPVTNPRK